LLRLLGDPDMPLQGDPTEQHRERGEEANAADKIPRRGYLPAMVMPMPDTQPTRNTTGDSTFSSFEKVRWEGRGRRDLGISHGIVLTQAPRLDDRFLFLGKEDVREGIFGGSPGPEAFDQTNQNKP
jgi:hypothetical protein